MYLTFMRRAGTIAEVITALDYIIDWSKKHGNRTGYFAALYQAMTIAVQKGIKAGLFKDAVRMEKLDVLFANRYLDAWHSYHGGKPCTLSWKSVFNAASNIRLTVIQHLLLGINTHINLDLAIAAAATCEGEDIFLLQSDFEKINEVIASLTEVTYESLCRLWFPLKALGKISGSSHDAVVNFSIVKAREASWTNAVALAQCGTEGKEKYIHFIDGGVAILSGKIINPGKLTNFLLTPVRYMENRNVARNVEVLEKELLPASH